MKEKSKKRNGSILATGLFLAGFLFFLLFRSSAAIQGALRGLKVSVQVVVPSLFPFFVLSSLCVNLGYAKILGKAVAPIAEKLFHLPGIVAAPLVSGFLGGYPMGAKMVASVYEKKELSVSQAQRTLLFCNNSGPAFFFGVIGGSLFSSAEIGLAIFLIHILTALVIGFFLRVLEKRKNVQPTIYHNAAISKESKATIPFPQAFTQAVRDSAQSLLGITGFITFFTIVLALLETVPIYQQLPELIKITITGLLELSTGITSMGSSHLPLALQVGLAAGIVSWGGLCVHFQTLSVLPPEIMPLPTYLISKLFHGSLSFFLTFLWASWRYPGSAQVTAVWHEATESLNWQVFSFYALLLFVLLILAKIFLLITSGKLLKKSL